MRYSSAAGNWDVLRSTRKNDDEASSKMEPAKEETAPALGYIGHRSRVTSVAPLAGFAIIAQ